MTGINTNHVMSTPVLVLNSSFEPLGVTSAKRAMKLLWKDVALSLVDHDHNVVPGWPLPSVVKLRYFATVPHKTVLCSRQGIICRDDNTCQYCGIVLSTKSLTLDHVIPKSRGGKATWNNLVAACRRCNRLKSDRTPAEAGMPLLRIPKAVDVHSHRHSLRKIGKNDDNWRKYLYFDTDVEASRMIVN